MYFKVPACIAGDHDPDSEKVVLGHLLLGDDPHSGPLRGRGREPALEVVVLRDALRLLRGGGLVGRGQAVVWEGTKAIAGH